MSHASELMDALPARLANWRRWLLRYGGRSQCESVEGDYRSPQSKHWHPPGPRPLPAKEADAWDIEMAAATMSIRLHLALKLKYVIGLDDKRCAEIFRREFHERIKAIDFEVIDWTAKAELLEALGESIFTRRTIARDRARRIIAKTADLMCD